MPLLLEEITRFAAAAKEVIEELDEDPQVRRRAAYDTADEAFIDAQLVAHGLSDDKLALVGFSQGTMMALHVDPRRAKALAGVIGFSGMLADPDALVAEVVTRPPILLVHGDADEVLPVSALHQAEGRLKTLDFEIATHVSRGLGHSIDEAGLQLGVDFLAKHLT